MKITNKIAIVLASILMLGSMNAYATGPYVAAEAGFYGLGSNDNPFKNLFDNDDEVKLAGRVAAGYLWDVAASTKLGLETGFTKNQNISDTFFGSSVKFKRHGFDLLGVADFHATDKFNLFAKAGAVYSHNEVAVGSSSSYISFSENKVVPKAVLGAGYDLSNALNVNLSLAHEFMKSGFEGIPSSSMLMLGMKYNFAA